jgi:hypothetical protein
MKKKYTKNLFILLVIILVIVYFKYTSLTFNLDVTKVYSINYGIEYFDHGYSYLEGEVTNKEEISKMVEYFNSIVLISTFEKPKNATQVITFHDKEGNVLENYAFGGTVLWDGNRTYIFGDFYQNRIKELLSIE